MKCELVQNLDVHRFAVFAELAVYVKRPEMQALCRAAMKSGGLITGEAVRSILPEASDVAIKNILAWCQEMGLCNDSGRLTDAGEQTAGDAGEAPLLEQGVYGMWGVEHPVLGGRVLHWERIRLARDDEGKPDKLPLTISRRQSWRSVIDDKRFEIRDLPSGFAEPLGYTDHQHPSTCQFRWAIDFHSGSSQWTLVGHIAPGPNGRPTHFTTTPTDRPCDLRSLADQWMIGAAPSEGRWNAKLRRLDVGFKDSLGEAVRETFATSVRLAEVKGPDGEVYREALMADVPVGPQSHDDAHRWMLWRLLRRLAEPGYRSLHVLNQDYALVTEGTPLESMTTAPDPDDVLRAVAGDRAVFWRVAAGLDLNCEPEQETGQVTKEAATDSPETVSVRVFRGSNESMQKLLSQLLVGLRPRRVLLCDRFVRGPENLMCLKLMQDTLKRLYPDSRLVVLTDRDLQDPRQAATIQQAVGEPPLWYQCFGVERPHDRYLLVDSGGERVVWQMTNSPLDARPPSGKEATPDSPLKWRDLACIKINPSDLYYPFLINWFDEGKHR